MRMSKHTTDAEIKAQTYDTPHKTWPLGPSSTLSPVLVEPPCYPDEHRSEGLEA